MPDRVVQGEQTDAPDSGWKTRGRTLFSQVRTSNGMISLADQMVASATNFLTGIILARNCSKEEFGLYMLCFSVVLFAFDLQTSLLSSPYMVYSQRLEGKRHAAYTGNLLVQQALLAVLILLALVVGTGIAAGGIGPEGLSSVLYSLSLVVWFIMLRECIRRICFAGLKMATALLLDGTVAVVQIGSLLFLAYFNLLSAASALYAIGLACSLTCLAWFFFRRESYAFHKKFFKEDLRKNLSFGKWIFGSSLLWALSMSLYPWLLAFFHGTGSTGVWAACWGVIAIANPLLLGIQNFLGPKIIQAYTGGGGEALSQFVKKVSLRYALIILPPALFLFFFGGRLVALFYGHKYGGNGLVVSVLAVQLLVMAASFTLSRGLLALEQARVYFMANIVPLLVMLTFGIYLVKQLGVVGVAFALLAGTATTATVMLVIFFKLIRAECMPGSGND